jgi:hypothetical protein
MRGAMAKRRPEPIDRDKERAVKLSLVDVRGPTRERMELIGDEFEVGDDKQGTKVVRILDTPLNRMLNRKAIDPVEYTALQRFHHHWYHSGLIPGLGSVDLNRVFAADPSGMSGMAKSEAQAHHRKQYREACELLGRRARITVDNVVCSEQTLEVAGYALGWPSKPQAIAAASETLRDAGYRLAKLWGIG